MTTRRQQHWRRAAPPLILLALSLAFTGAASAQTTSFQATITGHNPKPNQPCVSTATPPTAAVFCSSASIAGYGPAVWTLNPTPPALTSPCFTYTGTTTFQLLTGGGTLVLDENKGTACSPGNSAAGAVKDWFGAPIFANASWTVDPASTGIFAGVTGGGTDTAHTAGAAAIGTYTGTLAHPSSS